MSENGFWMSKIGEITILKHIKKLFLPKILLLFRQLKEKSNFSNYLISIFRSMIHYEMFFVTVCIFSTISFTKGLKSFIDAI
jgi:hypothetical protein